MSLPQEQLYDGNNLLQKLTDDEYNTKNMWVDEVGLIHVTIQQARSSIPDLPHGYAYKGGAARVLLSDSLGLAKCSDPRDLDIIRISALRPDDKHDDALSQRYMPDDYSHGYGVEIVDNPKEYFSQHDFTINELCATTKEVITTPQCIKDTIDRTLRFTEYEEKYSRHHKLCAKALRMAATSEFSVNGEYKIAESITNNIDENINPFFVALNLDRALGSGEKYADAYIKQLHDYNILPEDKKTTLDVVDYLSDQVENFTWKHRPIRSAEEHEEMHAQDIALAEREAMKDEYKWRTRKNGADIQSGHQPDNTSKQSCTKQSFTKAERRQIRSEKWTDYLEARNHAPDQISMLR